MSLNDTFKQLDAHISKLRKSSITIEESIATHSSAVQLLKKAELQYNLELEKLDNVISNAKTEDTASQSKDVLEINNEIEDRLNKLDTSNNWIKEYSKIHTLIKIMEDKIENAQLDAFLLNDDGSKNKLEK